MNARLVSSLPKAGVWLLLGVAGCSLIAGVNFRVAMNKIQRDYVTLTDAVEKPDNLVARAAAANLQENFAQPTVTDHPRLSAESVFTEQLAAIRQALAALTTVEEKTVQDRLFELRDDVGRACDGCHSAFRD